MTAWPFVKSARLLSSRRRRDRDVAAPTLMHGHCEATLTRSPRRSSTARRPRACAKNGSPVHDREKSGPRGLLLVPVHPRAVSGACPEALRKQAGAAARWKSREREVDAIGGLER